ncbi:hypothetical protein [Kitasatospora sp. NPDC059327]|uniref:hypothetical protein n=1 Tax=Kitasatospora sp. NPDC059327 TaxID=3346803 RepID=UPI0036961C51
MPHDAARAEAAISFDTWSELRVAVCADGRPKLDACLPGPPDRAIAGVAGEQGLATLRQALEQYDAPVAWPEIGELSVRGWYGTR